MEWIAQIITWTLALVMGGAFGILWVASLIAAACKKDGQTKDAWENFLKIVKEKGGR